MKKRRDMKVLKSADGVLNSGGDKTEIEEKLNLILTLIIN
jgi:hypothetical protein